MKLAIHISGGLVEWVQEIKDKSCPGKDITGIIIVDTDTEDCGSDDDLTVITDSNGDKARAYIHEETIYPCSKTSDLNHLVETYFDNEEVDTAQQETLPLLISKMRTQEGRDRIARLLKGV